MLDRRQFAVTVAGSLVAAYVSRSLAAAPADAYIARLRAFAVVLDQETARIRHDAALKVSPPDFLVDQTLKQMRALRSAAAADSILATSIATRTRKLGIPGGYGEEAARIAATEVYPALDRQAAPMPMAVLERVMEDWAAARA